MDQTAAGTAVVCVVVLVSEEGTSDSERAPRLPAGGGGGERAGDSGLEAPARDPEHRQWRIGEGT